MSRGESAGRICQDVSGCVAPVVEAGHACAYLMKFINLYRRQSRPEPRDSLGGIVPCNAIDLLSVAYLVLKMGEMKAIGTIGVQLEKARGYDGVFQVDGFTSDVAISLQDKACFVGDDKVVFDQLAIEDVAAIGEESEPA